MDNISPWLMTCGLICVWPLLIGWVGFLIGRGAIRLQSPIVRHKDVGFSMRQAPPATRRTEGK